MVEAFPPGVEVERDLQTPVMACGNTLFGALGSAVSRTLGEITRSIYLLHGKVLYCLFTFILPRPGAAQLTPLGHWLRVLGATPVLILASFGAKL